MHSSRMHTTGSSSHPGGLHQAPTPLEQTTPTPWHAGIAHNPLLQGMLGYHLQYMLGYHPPVNRITNRCKNITLPQTSFAGGNKKAFQSKTNCPLANRCIGYLYEGGLGQGWGWLWVPKSTSLNRFMCCREGAPK